MKDYTFSLDNLFKSTISNVPEKLLILEYLKAWYMDNGLFPIKNKNEDIITDPRKSINVFKNYQLDPNKIYIEMNGMIKPEEDDIFKGMEFSALRVVDDQPRFVVFEKANLNDKAQSQPYKVSYLKYDLITKNKVQLDRRGAVLNAIEPAICEMPNILELQNDFY